MMTMMMIVVVSGTDDNGAVDDDSWHLGCGDDAPKDGRAKGADARNQEGSAPNVRYGTNARTQRRTALSPGRPRR